MQLQMQTQFDAGVVFVGFQYDFFPASNAHCLIGRLEKKWWLNQILHMEMMVELRSIENLLLFL